MFTTLLTIFFILFSFQLVNAQLLYDSGIGQWNHHGKNIYNTRSLGILESEISSLNINRLQQSLSAPTAATSGQTPFISADGLMVFPDRSGNVYAFDLNANSIKWQINVRTFLTPTTLVPYQYYPDFNSWVHNTPLLVPGSGHRADILVMGNYHSGDVFAVDKDTGRTLWVSRVENHTEAALTQGFTYVPELDLILGGVSSNEELAGALLTLFFGIPYPTYTFRGSFFAMRPETGELIWKTYTTNVGNNGAAVWGSSPSCDITFMHSRPQYRCYISAGNNYEVSAAWSSCQQNVTDTCGTNSACSIAGGKRCAGEYDTDENKFDSIIQYDPTNGKILNFYKSQTYDSFEVLCLVFPNSPFCDAPPNDDYDFPQAPVLMDILVPQQHGLPQLQHLFGAGSKSGYFYLLNRDSFTVKSVIYMSSGSGNGGSMWGSASDGRYFYSAVTGVSGAPYQLKNGQTTNFGSINKIDPISGQIVAQFVHPIVNATMPHTYFSFFGALTIVNDVLIAVSGSGYIFFLKTEDFSEIRRINIEGGSLFAGPAVVGNRLCFPTGYTYGQSSPWTMNGPTKVVCYSLEL